MSIDADCPRSVGGERGRRASVCTEEHCVFAPGLLSLIRPSFSLHFVSPAVWREREIVK